jgi:O-antigen ligase
MASRMATPEASGRNAVLPASRRRPIRHGLPAGETAILVAAGAVLGGFVLVSDSLPAVARFLALLAVLAPLLAMVVGHLRFILLGVVALDLPFQWDANLGYNTAAADLGSLGGLNISLTTLALVGLYAMWTVELLTVRVGVARPRWRAVLPFGAFTLATALSILWARDARLAEYEVALIVQMLLLFLYVASTVKSWPDVQLIVAVLLVGLVLESVLIMLAFYTGESINFAGLSTHNSTFAAAGHRPSGTLGSPNSAGSYLAFMLAPAAVIVMSGYGRLLRMLAGVAFVLGACALVLTQSRGAWVGFVAAMAIILAVSFRQQWLTGRVVMIAAVGAAAVALVAGGVVASRLSGSDDGAAGSRIPLMHLAADVIGDNPVLGVGANNFPLVIPDYAGPEFGGEFLYTVHNKYLLVWAEAGLGALLAYLWFLGSTVRRGWRGTVANNRVFSPIALGLTAGICGHLVHMTVDDFRGRPGIQSLVLFAGLLVAIAALVDRSDPDYEGRMQPRRPQTHEPGVVPYR